MDEYVWSHSEGMQRILGLVRSAIRKAVPKAEEGISYGMPTYKLAGGPVIYFAGWKKHYSIYPASGVVVAALGSELEPYAISKGTIRFPLDEPVPVKLIGRIAKLRAGEVAER